MTKVSVCTVTYNHAPYIAQAIESVLMQRRPGLEIEMVIGEDVSTDNTRSIVADYARRYPEIIKPIFHERNVGAGNNSLACLNACTGDFIAALEGDDYWTDPHKLQKQVDFLESHPDYTLCFHNVRIEKAGIAGGVLYNSVNQATTTSALDLAIRNYIATVSCVYRRILTEIPAWFAVVPAGDFSLSMMHARYGKIGYLPDVMAVYREHAQSSWQSKSTFYKESNWFKTLAFLVPEFDGPVQEQLVSSQLAALQSTLADDTASATDKSEFLAAHAIEIQSLLNIAQPQFEQQRIKVKSLEHRIVSTFVEPLRNIFNR
jgi:glycosyltransferase involved in cell wall biosynthesis